MSGARLDLAGLGKSFRGLRAVHDVSFSVPAGAIHALIGPNGAGKTTIFNMIAGVFAPDAGTVSLDGKVISGLRPDRVCDAGIGRTFQLVKPFKGLSVLENVTVGALHRKARSRRGARQRVGDPVAARPPRPPPSARREPDPARPQAAGGGARARHRAQAAAARRGDGGPAPDRGRRHGGFLRELNRARGLTILLIEHVMRAVMALAAEVVVVSYGEKIAEGTPQEIARHQAVLDVYLGEQEAP